MSESFDIREYVESALKRATDSAGSEITAICPFCEKWGGFYVNAENGRHVCFKCGERGKSIVAVVACVEGLSQSDAMSYVFKRSVKLRRKTDLFSLADRVRALKLGDATPAGRPAVSVVDVPLPKQFKPCWDGKSWKLPTYLKGRGIKSKTAAAWGLGFCRFGEYAGRLVIPIICPNGRSFTARDMTGDQQPKYLNPPGADHGRLLIGWQLANTTGDLCIVEGPLDAVKWYQHGINVVAVGGKFLHSDQLAMLFALSPSQAVTVALDPEELTAPYDAAKQLSIHFENVYIAKLPDGVDPGSSSRSVAEAAVESAIRYTGERVSRLKGRLEALKTRA